MSYQRCLFLFVYSGIQHILCCVFLRIVYAILPVSLDCPFFIDPSVFSNVYYAIFHWIDVHLRCRYINISFCYHICNFYDYREFKLFFQLKVGSFEVHRRSNTHNQSAYLVLKSTFLFVVFILRTLD